MKVYTRGGDTGETALYGGRRAGKDTRRIWAYGEVDELNSTLGVAATELAHEDLREILLHVQSVLFDAGSELATPDVEEREARSKLVVRVGDGEVEDCEAIIDRLDQELPPLQSFVLPGGCRGAALLHLARTICRRAERRVVKLARCESVSPELLRYLNRLSDLLFVMARVANVRAGVEEPKWIGRERGKRDES